MAPLTLNDDVFVAAGSTITTEVEAGALAVGRSRQSAIPGWVHPAVRGTGERAAPAQPAAPARKRRTGRAGKARKNTG